MVLLCLYNNKQNKPLNHNYYCMVNHDTHIHTIATTWKTVLIHFDTITMHHA